MLLAIYHTRFFAALFVTVALFAIYTFAPAQGIHAQTRSVRELRPDMRHALNARAHFAQREEASVSEAAAPC